jgi:DNA-binding IclR family transcriptional regulator
MSVASVDRAFQLLRAVDGGAATVSALSKQTGLALATTARLLNTLEQVGALSRVDKRYRIGPAIADLAGQPAAYDLAALAAGHMSDLVALTDETAGVAEAAGHTTFHLAQLTAERDVTVKDWTGTRVPVHHGAIGFVVMACWSAGQIDNYLASPLERLTGNTVTDPAVIRTRIEHIRRRGWIWTVDEYASGVATVAAPVRDGRGAAVGSLHVYGPSYRFPADDGQADEVGRAVAERARAISAVLGWTGTDGGETNGVQGR